MRTWLTENLQIEVPIMSAPMAGVAGGHLARAVSQAGGFGMIGVGAHQKPEDVARQQSIARSGERPYGVGLLGWALDDPHEMLAEVISGAPALVSVSCGGDITDYVTSLHNAGIMVAAQVGNLDEAEDADALGVDLLVARGAEAGGHGRNEVATLPLLQAVLETVDTPVVAAGGIGTARGLAAVLAAGAAGAWVGTAFAACTESTNPPAAREAIAAADMTDTVYTHVFDLAQGLAWPPEYGGRALINAVTAIWAGREEQLQRSGPTLTALSDQVLKAKTADDVDYAPVYAGQAAGLVESSRSAAEVVADFARAEELLRRAAGIA